MGLLSPLLSFGGEDAHDCLELSFRDSSTNKGGVTSSSLEVLAGLALNDAEFLDLMTGEKVSDFYLGLSLNPSYFHIVTSAD